MSLLFSFKFKDVVSRDSKEECEQLWEELEAVLQTEPVAIAVRGADAANMRHMAVQAVFTLLDTLSRWSGYRYVKLYTYLKHCANKLCIAVYAVITLLTMCAWAVYFQAILYCATAPKVEAVSWIM